MSTLKMLYAAEVAITCGIDALTNSTTAARQSTVIDNTANLYTDALVQLRLQTTAGSLAAGSYVYVYLYGWSKGQGNHYTDTISGVDGAYTLPSSFPTNFKSVQVIPYNVSANTVMYSSSFSVAAAFGGVMPAKWGIVVNNQTGLALSGTANQQVNNIASYVGVQLTTS